MDDTTRHRIRHIFLSPRPNFPLMTAADLLGMTLVGLGRLKCWKAGRGGDRLSAARRRSTDSLRRASLPVPGATTRFEAIGVCRHEMSASRFSHECPAAGDRCLPPQTSTSAGSDMNVTALTHRCPGADTNVSRSAVNVRQARH